MQINEYTYTDEYIQNAFGNIISEDTLRLVVKSGKFGPPDFMRNKILTSITKPLTLSQIRKQYKVELSCCKIPIFLNIYKIIDNRTTYIPIDIDIDVKTPIYYLILDRMKWNAGQPVVQIDNNLYRNGYNEYPLKCEITMEKYIIDDLQDFLDTKSREEYIDFDSIIKEPLTIESKSFHNLTIDIVIGVHPTLSSGFVFRRILTKTEFVKEFPYIPLEKHDTYEHIWHIPDGISIDTFKELLKL